MRRADAVGAPDVAVIVDDTMNVRWPEVTFAVCELIRSESFNLEPFAATPAKTYFCRSDYTDFYRSILAKEHKISWTVDMLGNEVDVYSTGVVEKLIERARRAVKM